MSIKSQSYLYPTPEGVWMFQIFVPKYMRHIFGGKNFTGSRRELKTSPPLNTSVIRCSSSGRPLRSSIAPIQKKGA